MAIMHIVGSDTAGFILKITSPTDWRKIWRYIVFICAHLPHKEGAYHDTPFLIVVFCCFCCNLTSSPRKPRQVYIEVSLETTRSS